MALHLSIRDRWRIVSLNLDQARSVRQIARLIPCSIQTVYSILDLFEETNDVVERNGRGRHTLFSANEFHTLRQILYRYPNDTSSNIAHRLFQRTGLYVSSRTIRRHRSSLGFRPVHARTQPLINTRHAQQRLDFCLLHAAAPWNNIIFSDEKAFEVDVSGLVYWIPYGRPRPIHFQSQVQFRVAIFGAVWYDGRSVSVVIGGRTNTTTYVEYLQAALNPHLRRLRGYHFIHDRPTWAHTTLAHDWLRSKHIRCMDNYPAVSPDLNAVESVWSWMNRCVQRNHPSSQQHLEFLVRQAWNTIAQNVIRGYINHLPTICNQIITNRGWESRG
jgi:transposase